MERVMIIGCSGAGKTTLSRQVGEKTGLPVVHLDQIWWSPGNWEHLSREEFDRLLLAEMAKDRWILDGNYNRTLNLRLERADTVIYLDLPRWRCLLGWIGRVIKNRGRTREDMGPGCREWFDPEMAGWIWNFNRQNREEYLKKLCGWNGELYILRSRREVKQFLEKL